MIINNNGLHHKIGRGYIAIPSDFNRVSYIRDCYTNMWVSIITEDGGFMNRVPIPPDVLNFVEFPDLPSQLGSPIVFNVDDMTNNPIIVSRYNKQDNLGDGKEYQFKFKRQYRDKVVEISGSPKDNALNLIVNGANNGGKLNIILHSNDKSSSFNARVAGVIDFQAQDTISTTGVNKTSFQTFDTNYKSSSVFEQLPNSHRFISGNFNINDGKENFLLGQKWKKLMSDLIDEVANSTVSTSIGQQPLVNAEKITNFKTRLDEALSLVGYLNK